MRENTEKGGTELKTIDDNNQILKTNNNISKSSIEKSYYLQRNRNKGKR